ncbi:MULTISPECIES: HlyD family type I secretion periplasmic adaptor subunit [Thalassospira]|uniref:Membrane fusion protein (MFP) family protein n=1 Tax=Thalassospira indica TaxID=1891279 RepID=A0ABM6Y229_9PROT|nr:MULTISPECIES: HlyD family type I secretion periplasmic adaptor subunit [Thalassospira]MBE70161.1 HlyD family type I secretion periplasmic adaptor subunit [Thalassospira sp.]OAZ13545.1 membrane protein [Thalassospira profundimaris]BDW87836.1 HlyD family type I secretion periplasmic adaptor subunit [Thalassospira tepidiphila]AXO15982.1 HlyD family type I secretion periplasmic adaptor subunit [Thalassospira indica]EKF08989.1 membrane-fusion protein [Thalassospira profundimaris WP0211]|tara:strand:- start:2210 stop:3565 length:1356 start_codon:yes stop_codon:yes gene_type:complete
MSEAAVQDTAIQRFRRSRRMARYLSHAVLLEEGGISVFVRSAMVMLSVGFLALIAWSATTEIKETAITFGQVMPTSAVNKIQHLEGGIIEQIMVRDGDLVEQGQVLIRLKADGAQAELSQTETRLGNLQLEAERYRALAEGREPDFTTLMVQYPELAQNQDEIYRIQTELDANQSEILEVQIKERNAELAQLSEQEATLRKSVDLLSQEVTMRRSLYEQGLNSKVLFLNIQRELNEAQGNLSGVIAEKARARETIAEANLRLNELEKTQREEAITELGRLGGEIAQAREALRKLRDRVDRLEIIAPTRGYIKGLQFTTIGGVIAPAQVVMELVPVDDVLIAETRISTEDIGHVHLGQPVTVKVSAFDFIRYGGINGELVSISASTFVDEDGRPYYKGKVALEADAVGEGASAQKIIPGMTVQADIQTGERTLLQYLLKPVYVSLDQAFSER